MSFILDALKKSESERHRQAGPVLMEVRVAPRRPRLPVWAIVILVALALNLGVIGYLLLRSPTPAPAATAAPVVAAPAPVAAQAPTAPQPALPAATTTLPDPALATTPLPPASEPAAGVNPADFAPALPRQSLPPASAAQAAADMGLPSLNDLNASGANLPEQRLSLHVYDADPSRRYVLLNSTRLREGEATPDGIRLERVTETGVILSWRGRRFTIQRGE